VYFEGSSLQAPGISSIANKYWYLFVVSSSWGCLVNACGLGVVKNIGAVWFKGINNIKNILLLFFGILVYGDVVTVLQAFGYALSLAGFGRYTYVKNTQMLSESSSSESSHSSKSGERTDEENPPLASSSRTETTKTKTAFPDEREPLLQK
jgi:hypothetical protein